MFGHRSLEREIFPDPYTECMFEGIIAYSAICNPEMLFEAYSFGIFPWPHNEQEVLWFCPDRRGVLYFDEFKVPQRLTRKIKNSPWEITVNKAFSEVIDNCAMAPRKGESGTWITEKIKSAYKQFHEMGYAHSVECWNGEDLVGGIYGVSVGGAFSGESMFFKESDASKACFVHLIELLKSNGLEWMDIQMVTPVTKQFGGVEVERSEFLNQLHAWQKKELQLEFLR